MEMATWEKVVIACLAILAVFLVAIVLYNNYTPTHLEPLVVMDKQIVGQFNDRFIVLSTLHHIDNPENIMYETNWQTWVTLEKGPQYMVEVRDQIWGYQYITGISSSEKA